MTPDTPTLPRGIRNNNPGNLEGGGPWQGEKGRDAGFLVFDLPVSGLRALAIDLFAAYTRDRLLTLSMVMDHYAPPNENDTTAYIEVVAQRLGLTMENARTFDIRLNKPWRVLDVMRLIIAHENGSPPATWQWWPDWYSVTQYVDALRATNLWQGGL